MNRRQIVILLVILAIVAGLSAAVLTRERSSWQASERALGAKLLRDFPMNDVARIHIKDAQSEVNLIKKDNLWRVQERGDYPADFGAISEFLIKAEGLKVVQAESISPDQRARLELVEPGKGDKSGTLVEFADKGGKIMRSMLLGKKHMRRSDVSEAAYPDGRYVILASAVENVAVVADPLSSVEAKPSKWLAKAFFKIEKPRTIAFDAGDAAKSWTLTHDSDTAEWKLANPDPGRELDSNQAFNMGNAFSYFSFADVVIGARPEVTGLDKAKQLTIETFEGFTYRLRIGNKTGADEYYLRGSVDANLPKARSAVKGEKPEDKDKLDKEFNQKLEQWQAKLKREKDLEKWIYLVTGTSVQPYLKDRAQLYQEKKEPVPEKKEPLLQPKN
jgi:uncharacterized protein DUF4340